MRLLIALFILLGLAAPSLGGYIFVLEEQPMIDLDVLFSPARQQEFISPEGLISFGPNDRFSYSVFEEYTVKERLILFQVCQKWLYFQDQETLLYMYQYVVKPYPFPLLDYPLARETSVGAPGGILLVMVGLIALSARRLRCV